MYFCDVVRKICISRGLYKAPFLVEMITKEDIEGLLEKHLEGSDVFVVEVKVSSGNEIRVHVDTPDGISIDRCVQISRFLNESMDREVEDYALEVSSPGAAAPYRVKQQYEKNAGRKVEVLLRDGQKKEGRLEKVGADGITLTVKGKEIAISFEEIKKTKTIISFNG